MAKLYVLVIICTCFITVCYSQESKREKREREANEKFEAEYQKWLFELKSINFPIVDGKRAFEFLDSLDVKGKAKGDLVVSFKVALSDAIKKAKNAIDMEDKEAGIVIAKVTDEFTYVFRGDVQIYPVRYSIKFNAKDGKFRLRLTDIEVGNSTSVYYSLYNKPIEYTSIDISEFDGGEKKQKFKELTNRLREESLFYWRGLSSYFETSRQVLGLAVIRKSKDSF